MLNTPVVQRKVIEKVTTAITEKSGYTIGIGNSQINLFRGLVFNNVTLIDSFGLPLLKTARLEVGIKIIPLFRKKVDLRDLRLVDANIFLTKTTPDSPINLESFIKSLTSKKKSKLPWHLDFRSILLRKCRLSYDVLSAKPSKKIFDANHIFVNDISALLILKIKPENNIYFEIRKLNATERCGLQIDQLKLIGSIKNNSIKIQDFYLKSHESKFRIPLLESSFSSFKDLDNSDSIKISPTQLKATVIPSDFSCIFPFLSNFSKNVELTMSFSGKVNDFSSSLRLNLENLALCDGRVSFKDITDFDNSIINGQVDLLRINPEGLKYLTSVIFGSKFKLPNLNILGTISYRGNIMTVDKNLILKGAFSTLAGNLETNIDLSKNGISLLYNGHLKSDKLDLSRIFTERSGLGNIAFDLTVKGSQKKGAIAEGNVEGMISNLFFQGYEYKNLSLNGKFNKEGYEGKAILNDINGMFDFSGLINLSEEYPIYKFDLIAENVNLKALKLVVSKGNSLLSFRLNSDFAGRFPEDFTGNLIAEDFSFYNNGYDLKIKEFKATIKDLYNSKVVTFSSDLFSGEAYGKFNYKDFLSDIKSLMYKYVPSLTNEPVLTNYISGNNFDFHFNVKPDKILTKVLGLPFDLNGISNIDGYFRGYSNKCRLKATVPQILYGKTDIRDINLLLENPQNEMKFLAHAQAGSKGNYLDIDTDIRSMNDQSMFKFFWSNSGSETHSGNISSSLRFSRDAAGFKVINASILPTNLILNDSVWNVRSSSVTYEKKRIKVKQFELYHRNEFIKVDGYASDLNDDTLKIYFNSFSLDEIFRILPTSNFSLGGKITGSALCPHLFRNSTLNASLSVSDFSLNNFVIGNLNAKSYWNSDKKALILNGEVNENNRFSSVGRRVATATGSYYPIGDSINLDVDGYKVPLNFLTVYMKNILGDIEGFGSGKIKVVGPMNNIGIYAKAFAENASFGIDLLNTRYNFTDSVFLTPKYASFRNIKITDKEGNIAYANGYMTHDYFKNFEVSIKVRAENILAMDIPVSSDAYFSGKAYGTGTLSITGPQNDIVIDINISTDEKTKAVFSFLDNNEIDEFNYIYFKKPRSSREDVVESEQKKKKSLDLNIPSNFTVNLQVEANQNAELILITDPSTGDEIRARGSGAIRIVMDESMDFELFGRYTIDNGSYKFVYENLLRRDFDIVRGGTIDFTGNPFAAQLDISANYLVNPQLTDLLSVDELSSLNLNRSSIPVNCVLNLTGELQRPGIKLGLGFPSADEELRRRIMNVINTDEIMNQQIVFLLLFGRFSTTTNNIATGQSGMSSVLNTTISTLASQFNKMLNNVLGNTNMSFDFDYQNAAYELGAPGEWKVGMSGQWLDNRLTIEGNLGSRENLTQNGTSQFIGEFDANLRMKNSEKWSWKLFNRANDNRYFKSALNTQGFGVVYRENYNSLTDLFKQMLESIKKPFKKD